MSDHTESRITGARVLSVGGSGRIEFELDDGNTATVACDVTTAPRKPPKPAPEEVTDEVLNAELETEREALEIELGEQTEDDTLATEQEAHEAEESRLRMAAEVQHEREANDTKSETGSTSGPEPVELRGKLPSDFPGHKALEEADVTTYGQVRKAQRAATGWTHITGIGPATNAEIALALGLSLSE